MTRKTPIALAALAVALVLPAAAAAKGASKATIEGPTLKGAVAIPGNGEYAGTPLGNITQDAGYFAAAFGPDPQHQMLPSAPRDLGPAYQVTYVVPGPNNKSSLVRQTLYPYAAGGAVSYMAPNQPFMGSMLTAGGWYRGGSSLKQDLVAIGLPAKAPGNGGFGLSAGLIAGVAAAGAALILLLAAFRLRIRRRPEPTAA